MELCVCFSLFFLFYIIRSVYLFILLIFSILSWYTLFEEDLENGKKGFFKASS